MMISLAIFGLSAANPMLLWGTALIAAPILIHLLSKRKFRVIEWAAMDFLRDADRRNRRRVRLEHLILLLLRCLAILLLSLLVARLFVSASLFGGAAGLARVERIVVLDNSPSMSARTGARTAFDDARQGTTGFLRQLADEHPGDTLTLLTTSAPDQPLISGQPLRSDRVEDLVRTLETVKLSDIAANYGVIADALRELARARGGNLSQAVYIVTDLRATDWTTGEARDPQHGLPALFKQLREEVESIHLVDVGGPTPANLAITSVTPQDKVLVAGVPARFEIGLRNYGTTDLREIEVAFGVADAVPQRAEIPLLRAGTTAAVPFTLTLRSAASVGLVASVEGDEMPADNQFCLAARVLDGVRVLIVNGEPALDPADSETFFLERALHPPGDLPSGNQVQVVSETQFETIDLAPFQSVILANVYHLPEERLQSLTAWVRQGGGLIFFLGDQVDEMYYNAQLWREGEGLFPLQLVAIDGDQTEREWQHFSVKTATHPILRVFTGVNNPFLQRVKLFRWWTGRPQSGQVASGRVNIIATVTGTDDTPAIVESQFGAGRVVAITTSADGEWNTWPADPSYLVTAMELLRFTVPDRSGADALVAGTPLQAPVDVARHEIEARITPPGQDQAVTQRAEPAADGRGLILKYNATGQRGFYRVDFTTRQGNTEPVLYAANIDPRESDLQPAKQGDVERLLADAGVTILSGASAMTAGAAGQRAELWRWLGFALLAVLCTEQFLGWWFGQRR